ncbi:hypothetical protein [Paenibacillus sp. YN15]|uniref:hypothetical protein n=1 Tax=Paenibacillus sp. YN15 TaxID=1742774 RepID=UPI000DCD045A|nr:hypothetical protein [Paenibacillus sp. YN15]RAV02710.1 hypothetical protein DQG13_09415 [Paenibacillus sp. YN15]
MIPKGNPQKTITRYNPHYVIHHPNQNVHYYEFTMYRQTIEYTCPPFRVALGMLEGTLTIEGFGLLITRVVDVGGHFNYENFDCGVLSARSYEVNMLISKLANLDRPYEDNIAAAIMESRLLWEQNEQGNSFERTAKKKLRAKYRQNPEMVKPFPVTKLNIFDPTEERTIRMRRFLDQFR